MVTNLSLEFIAVPFFETACLVAFDSWPVSSVWLCIGKSLLTMPWQCLLWLQWLQRMTKSFLMSLTITELWYSIPRVSELQQKWTSAILASQIYYLSDYQWTCVWFWPPILSEYMGSDIWVLHDFTSVGLFPSQTNQFSWPICKTNSGSQKLLFYYLKMWIFKSYCCGGELNGKWIFSGPISLLNQLKILHTGD